MRELISVFILLLSGFVAAATEPDSVQMEANSSNFELNCFQRPAFFRVNYRNLPAARSLPEAYQQYGDEIEGNRLIDAELNIPIILQSGFRLISRVNYKNEILHLGESQYDEETFNFKNVGLLLGYQWFYNNNHFIAGHLGASLKAEKHDLSEIGSILDYNGSVVWGFENERYTAGAGVLTGNTLGRFKIVPLLIYERKLNRSWHLDLKVPKKIEVTKALIYDNLYIYGAAEGEGATYFMNDHLLSDYEQIEYRRRSVDLKFGLEREISDWLWAGIELGVTQPINSVLIEQGKPTRKNIHDFNHDITPFVNLSVFTVPPRSLYKRLTK